MSKLERALAIWRLIAQQAPELDYEVTYREGRKDEVTASVMSLAHKVDTGALPDTLVIKADADFVPLQDFFASYVETLESKMEELHVALPDELEQALDVPNDTQEAVVEEAEQVDADVPEEKAAPVKIELPLFDKKVSIVSGLFALGLVALVIITLILNSMMTVQANQIYARNAKFTLSSEAWLVMLAVLAIGCVIWLLFNVLRNVLLKAKMRKAMVAETQE